MYRNRKIADQDYKEALGESATRNVCPVTGLPVLCKPEWTDVGIGKHFRANLSVIGNRILLSRPKGHAKRQDVQNVFNLNSTILAEEINGNPYVYIEDFSNLKGVSLRARKTYIDNIKKRDQLRGVIYFGLSPLLEMSVKLGKRLNIIKFNVQIAADYSQAVMLALEMLQDGEIKSDDSPVGNEYRSVALPEKKGKRHDIVSNPDWDLQLDAYSVRLEVIDRRIIHSFSTGYMEEKHVEPIKIKRREACDAMCPITGFEYFIAGVSDLKGGSRRARKLYMDSLKEWNAYKPFRMYIIYGANRFMRTAANLARPFMPFKVRTAKDFESALKLISEEEVGMAETPTQRGAGVSDEEAASSRKTRQYVDELLQCLGAVNWEIEGFDNDNNMEVDPSHPFRPVFEALELIKAELNELLEERRKSEEKLKESEKKYRELANSLPQVVFETDMKSNLTFVNYNAFDLFGYTQNDFDKGLNALQMISPEDQDRAMDEIRRTMSGKSSGGAEYTAKRKDGSTFPILIYSKPIISEDKPIGLRGIIVDLTERRKMKEKLRESEGFLNDVFESIKDGICVLNTDLTIRRVNGVMEQWYGENLPLEGKKCHLCYQNSSKPCDPCPTLRCLKSGLTEREIVQGLPGSPNKWLELYSFPMKDRRSGKIAGVVEFVRDITETKNLETQLRQSQKMEAIGTLAGGIAHDFNNLLTAIIGNTDLALLKSGKDNHEREELVEIKKAAKRAASLTSQLLAFSRRQVVQPKILNINEALGDMEKMLRRLIGEDIELSTVLKPGLGKVHIDPGQIDQILMNLVVNARDAMPQGGKLTIETSNVDLDMDYFRNHGVEEEPGPYMMLAISDTGTGMDEKTKSKIFDPFFSTKDKDKGTGLGLSTVYGIVKQNRGYVWVYSEPGGGATFKIFLPRAEGDAQPAKGQKPSTVKLRGSETILVVEDDDMVRDLACRILKRNGYKVLEAQCPEEAIKVSERHEEPIHLMLTDVVMPGMNGNDLAKRLEQLRPEMKTIYMSGYTDKAVVNHQILEPQLHFVQKPFRPLDLAREVREILDIEN